MNCLGNVIRVQRADDYARLIMLPDATQGWFDPALGAGEVRFTTVRAAQAARSPQEGV